MKRISAVFSTLMVLMVLSSVNIAFASAPFGCSDRVDNDGDGHTDYPGDTDCGSPYGMSEVARTEIPYVRNQLRVSVSDNRAHVAPGDVLEYVVIVGNPEQRGTRVDVTVSFPRIVQLIDAMPEGDRRTTSMLWNQVPLGPGQERMFTVRLAVDPRTPTGFPLQVVARAGGRTGADRTVVVPIGPGFQGPVVAFGTPPLDEFPYFPQTGIEDFTGPVEDTRQFLSPMSAAAQGNALPLVLWIALMGMGIFFGGVLTRKSAR